MRVLLAVTGPDGRWAPGASDDNVLGWLLFAAYAVAAVLALVAFTRSRAMARSLGASDHGEARAQRLLSVLWLLATALLLVLGSNKQLDLQTLLIQTGKDLAREQGWYERRARVQITFVKAVLLTTAAGGLALAFYLRRVLARSLLPLAGIALVLAYAALRTAAMERVPQLHGNSTHLWIVEAAGLVLLIAGAARFVRSPLARGAP